MYMSPHLSYWITNGHSHTKYDLNIPICTHLTVHANNSHYTGGLFDDYVVGLPQNLVGNVRLCYLTSAVHHVETWTSRIIGGRKCYHFESERGRGVWIRRMHDINPPYAVGRDGDEWTRWMAGSFGGKARVV